MTDQTMHINQIVAELSIGHVCDIEYHGNSWRPLALGWNRYTIHRLVTGDLLVYRHPDYSTPAREFPLSEFLSSERDGQVLRRVMSIPLPLLWEDLHRTDIQSRSKQGHPERTYRFKGGLLDGQILP